MHRIQIAEGMVDMPLPCNYFDLIGGTSRGGIIALMLGRLRVSVDEAIDCYNKIAVKVFSEVKMRHFGEGRYDARLLEEAMKGIVKERANDSEETLCDDGRLGGICKTFVCAMNVFNMNEAVLFRTYMSPKDLPIPCTVWQAARATSAGPPFFRHIIIGPSHRPEQYTDGGFGQNNPIREVLKEAEMIFPYRRIACVISIGTVGVIKAMVEIVTDCERTAKEMEKIFKNWAGTYFRFNVEDTSAILQGTALHNLGFSIRSSENIEIQGSSFISVAGDQLTAERMTIYRDPQSQDTAYTTIRGTNTTPRVRVDQRLLAIGMTRYPLSRKVAR